MERWAPVSGWTDLYEVSDLGRVRSLVYTNQYGTRPRRAPRIVKGIVGPDGYVRVWLQHQGARQGFLVQRLVLDAFVGPCPDGMEAAHQNGVRTENHLGNLVWKTHQDNINDQVTHGTRAAGDRVGGAKLDEARVREIRELYARGTTQRAIARQYGVTFQSVHDIVHRRTWAHVEG